MPQILNKPFFVTFCLVALSLSTQSCQSRAYNPFEGDIGEGGDAETAARISTSVDESVLKEEFAVRVNLKTNMATFYQSGKPVRTWKIASARSDGKSATPTGTFRFQELTVCQPWISTRNNAKAGPCDPTNPTGQFALWFSSRTYGLHGVDNGHLASVTSSSADSRRQSSGCVRNHPDNIEWLVKKVAPLYGTTPQALETFRKGSKAKSFSPKNRGLALVIGRWDTSPDSPTSLDLDTQEPPAEDVTTTIPESSETPN